MSEKRKISEISSAEPFYGERKCSNVKDGKKCTFGAYWAKQVGRTTHYVCGVHSKDGTRKKLKRDPDAKTKREAELEAALELAKKEAAERKARGVRGSATCQKMRMMSLVECQPGHRNVFPNYRHEKRVDGVGCASLSPMNLGPIEHNEKDVPVAATLENYHQFSKVFAFELDEHGNKVLDSFYTARDAAFADKTGHRHKFKRAFLKQKAKETGNDNINIPAFSLHAMPSGEERRYDYIGSRWFYCTWYEKLATQTAEFKQLVALMDDGYNLCICGYDGYAPTTTLMEHYLDTSRPFGHEMVLLCLLTIKESKDYPWNVYRRTHAQLYE